MPPLWQQIFQTNFTSWAKLADFLQLDDTQRQWIDINPKFPLNLPLRLAKKIAKGSLEDPIVKQFLPTILERQNFPGFIADPVGDCGAKIESKLLQKYEGRVLLTCTSACAMHCRYCFRQNFNYETEDKTFNKELQLIAEDKSIREVILSGGDPLSLPDRILSSLLKRLAELPHIRCIRFHTRFPMGIPERIDDEFLAIIKEIPLQFWFVLHANHPQEFDNDIFDTVKRLQKLGVVVMNQAVLLKGINDDAKTLQNLCELLVDHGILPYYLHQLDRVLGAAHFEVSEEKGKSLIETISKNLPGYAVPKYVREIPGIPSKTSLL